MHTPYAHSHRDIAVALAMDVDEVKYESGSRGRDEGGGLSCLSWLLLRNDSAASIHFMGER